MTDIRVTPPSREFSTVLCQLSWSRVRGPMTTDAIAVRAGLPRDRVGRILRKMEREGIARNVSANPRFLAEWIVANV